MIGASLSFGTMAALIKALGKDVPVVQVVFLRSLLSFPFLLWICRRQRLSLKIHTPAWIWRRTLFGLFAMGLYFYALTHMPLGECIFIGRSQPLILALLAPWMVKELPTRASFVSLLLGLLGVALITRPALRWGWASLAALGAAFFSSLAHLYIRKLNATDHPWVIVANFVGLSTVLTAPFALYVWHFLKPIQIVYLVGIALFASLGQIFMTHAYGKDKAPVVASATYISVLLALAYGYLFWREVPPLMSIFGGGLIVLGGLLLIWTRRGKFIPPATAST